MRLVEDVRMRKHPVLSRSLAVVALATAPAWVCQRAGVSPWYVPAKA